MKFDKQHLIYASRLKIKKNWSILCTNLITKKQFSKNSQQDMGASRLKNIVNFSRNEPVARWTGEFLPSEFFQDLIRTKAHLGTNIWTKDMSKFLLGSRNGISIINLEYTFNCLRQVLKFIETINSQNNSTSCNYPQYSGPGARILFVNTCAKFSELVKQTALDSNQSYINDRWIGGTLTNWKQISESVILYNKFSTQFDNFLRINNIQIPMYQKAKKRYEGLNLKSDAFVQNTRNVMNSSEKSIFASSFMPDVIILTNPDENNIVIKEAQLLKIPVIAFSDSNTKILGIDYIIPGNNKSIYFMYFCLNLITITLQKRKNFS